MLIVHFSDKTNWLDGVLGGRAGQYGVMLFFLLSGFLMAYLYGDKRFNKVNIRQYLVARFARVLPLYLLIVGLSFATSLQGLNWFFEIDSWEKLAAHLMFIDGESVLWSIAPEIHFYVIFIGIWFLLSWRPGYFYILVPAALSLLFFANFPRPHGDLYGIPYDFHLFRSLPYFLIGVVFGQLYKGIQLPGYLKSHVWVLALCLIPLMFPEFSPVTSRAKFTMWLNFEVLLVMGTVFFCVVFLVPDNNKLLANPVGDFVGKISYSLYLLHMPILAQVSELEMGLTQKLALFLALSLLAAWGSYYLFERPMAVWIRRATNKQYQTACLS